MELVPVKDIWWLVDVLDGQPDRRHDPAPDLALCRARGHREEGGEVDVGSKVEEVEKGEISAF